MNITLCLLRHSYRGVKCEIPGKICIVLWVFIDILHKLRLCNYTSSKNKMSP